MLEALSKLVLIADITFDGTEHSEKYCPDDFCTLISPMV